MNKTSLSSLFRTIPPERIGLHGEYDHCGLAKRVAIALTQHFEPEEVAHLQVTQRGAIVIIVGEVADRYLLNRLMTLVMNTNGTTGIELNGITISPPSHSLAATNDAQEIFSCTSYAY